MITKNTNRPEIPRLVQRLTSTVERCHVLGAIAAAALILTIGWVSSFGDSDVSQIEYGGTLVNLGEARELIQNANQLRQQYTVEYTSSQEFNELVDSISTWLPASIDWVSVEQGVRAIADGTEIAILTIEQGDHHIGERVGVVSATCTLQGSYRSLCEFLKALSQLPHPIACSEIRLHRLVADEGQPSEAVETRCNATLSLRIPYAASGTAAGQLLSVESKNAS